METLQLSALSYVLLAMLTFREMSGYELKSVIDKSVGHFYMRPALSQIYPELRRLAAHDLVKARKVVQEIRPDKRLYSLTPAGRAAVTQWLAEQSRPDRYKSDFQLRLFFANLLSHEQLLALLEDHHQWLTRSILILEERQHDLQTRMQGPTPEQELQFPLLVVELNLATFRAELAWIDGVIEQFAHQIA